MLFKISALARFTKHVPGSLESRLAAIIQTYDSQGNHRTASQVDNSSAYWLSEQIRRINVKPSREAFRLNRIDPQVCCVRVAGRRIDGVPLFDA